MLKFVSKLFKSAPEQKQRKARRNIKRNIVVDNKSTANVVTTEDINAGKGLFWGRYPHYPEMGSSYRKLIQQWKIDNQRSIKVMDPACGTDLCSLAGGSGPLIDFSCSDENIGIVDRNIKKMGLGNKIDRVLENSQSAATRKYFAQIMSFYPKNVNDADLDWDMLGDTTVPGGYVIISKFVDLKNGFNKPKPSEKISDNNEFYFYNMVDHTDQWKAHIEKRFVYIQESDPENFSSVSAAVTSAFKFEITEWIALLQKIKTNQLKIMSAIYKHDDVPD